MNDEKSKQGKKQAALEAIRRADEKLASIFTCGDGTIKMCEARISLKLAFELVSELEEKL